MVFKKNVKLAPLTTFKIGGKTDFFCVAESVEDLSKAANFARDKKLPIFILGGGSNLVVDDGGFRGLVIKNEILGIDFSESDSRHEVTAGAGENWDYLISVCVGKKFYGLENLSGIPGTVGGAAVQNIGAYGAEFKDSVKWVEALDMKTGKLKKFLPKQCRFGYRESFFKSPEGRRWVVARVCFSLSGSGRINIKYRDLENYFAESKNAKEISPETVRRAVLLIRAKKFPPLNKFGTAGSFFKNPIISAEKATKLAEQYPGLPVFPIGKDKAKVSLAWIIDRVCNLKGVAQGQVKISEKQALVLVSAGKATSGEVLGLAEKIKKGVFAKTGIEIEFEVEKI